MDPKSAYQQFGDTGYMQNPYIDGPPSGKPQALAWWKAFNAYRSQRRREQALTVQSQRLRDFERANQQRNLDTRPPLR